MNKELINIEINHIMSSCKVFAKTKLDPEGFLLSIGSNLGKIKKELENE